LDTRVQGRPRRFFSNEPIWTSVGRGSIEPLIATTTTSAIRSRFCWKTSGSKPSSASPRRRP
jgi:hypothetical protein